MSDADRETPARLIVIRGNSASGKSASWFRERDLLPGRVEQIIPASSSLDEPVRRIMAESGLGGGRAGLGRA